MDTEEDAIRYEIVTYKLEIAKGRPLMFQNIDAYVALNRENASVTAVALYPFDSHAGNYEFRDKVGQLVGNLMELQTLTIDFIGYGDDDDDDDEDETRIPDWEIVTRILRKLLRKVALCLRTGNDDGEAEDIQGLARVIHGHPMISGFISQADFTYANLIPWCYTLATLPYLERVTLCLQEPETEEQHNSLNPEPLAELLRAPALRFVEFDGFYSTDALCHATANALEEGSSVTDITF